MCESSFITAPRHCGDYVRRGGGRGGGEGRRRAQGHGAHEKVLRIVENVPPSLCSVRRRRRQHRNVERQHGLCTAAASWMGWHPVHASNNKFRPPHPQRRQQPQQQPTVMRVTKVRGNTTVDLHRTPSSSSSSFSAVHHECVATVSLMRIGFPSPAATPWPRHVGRTDGRKNA